MSQSYKNSETCPNKDDCDLDHSSHKNECDHGRSPIETQKHVLVKRTAIMITVLIKAKK